MLEIEVLFELELGIWKVEAEGIRCNFRGPNGAFIPNEEVTGTIITENQKVAWIWPLHFGWMTWSSSKDIENLLAALSIKRLHLGLSANNQMDADTWEEVLRIISEKGKCTMDELDLSLAKLPF